MIWLRQFRCPICGRVSLQTWATTYGIRPLLNPSPPPVWPRHCCGRESALCVLQIYDLKCDFEKRIWRNIFCLCQRLLVSSLRLPSFRLTFHFCRSHNILFFLLFVCGISAALLLTNIFVFFHFFFFALYLFHFYLLALVVCMWLRLKAVEYVDDAVLFVKHAKRCSDSRTHSLSWKDRPQSGARLKL